MILLSLLYLFWHSSVNIPSELGIALKHCKKHTINIVYTQTY